MKKTIPWVLAGGTFLGGAAMLAAYAPQRSREHPRIIELLETIQVQAPAGARDVEVWIPKPPSQGPQTAELLSVESPVPYRLTSEPEFGNQTVFLRTPGRSLAVTLRYRITRKPQAQGPRDAPTPADRTPRGLLVVNDEIREIARRQTRGLSTPMEKGRALYDYVLRRMAYDKSGEGWGRGDSVYACRIGKGNCTDFHSLFIALAMASGIPARFRMGLAVPPASQGSLSGYHCWAEFYAEGNGWVPVDISEAWKNPSRKNFYFGQLDGSRVLLSTGREIRLSPPQRGRPLNFLSGPYAEADGKLLYDIRLDRHYRDMDAGKG